MTVLDTEHRTRRSGRTTLPLVELWLVALLLVSYVSVSRGADPIVIWPCLLVQYGLMIAAVWRPIIVRPGVPTYISAEFLFLFFSYLIFFYPYQFHVLGIHDFAQTRYSVTNTFPEFANHAIILSLIGTVSFRAGISVLRRANKAGIAVGGRVRRLDRLTVQQLALPLFFLQAVLIAVYQVSGWRAAGEGRYSQTTTGGAVTEAVYLAITVLSMVAVALWMCAPSISGGARPGFLSMSFLLSITWAVRLLLAGDRNSFLLIAIVAICGLFTYRIRAGRWALAVLCVASVVLYQAIEELRAGRVESPLDLIFPWGASGRSAFEDDTSFNLSTISVRAGLAAVPEQFDFGYGLYQLVGFAGVLPFVRGAVIPEGVQHTQSSEVLTAVLLSPSANWGLGTNVISDAYMDFGPFGVPVLLFLVGLGVACAQYAVSALPTSPWRVVFYLVTVALVVEMPRYSIAFPARPLVWILLFFAFVAALHPFLGSASETKSLKTSGNGGRPHV